MSPLSVWITLNYSMYQGRDVILVLITFSEALEWRFLKLTAADCRFRRAAGKSKSAGVKPLAGKLH